MFNFHRFSVSFNICHSEWKSSRMGSEVWKTDMVFTEQTETGYMTYKFKVLENIADIVKHCL